MPYKQYVLFHTQICPLSFTDVRMQASRPSFDAKSRNPLRNNKLAILRRSNDILTYLLHGAESFLRS